jgi:GxxExxY protein
MRDDGFRHPDKLDERIERPAAIVVDSAYCVFRELGLGLLESTYECCLFFELISRGIQVRRQVQLPVRYRGHELDAGFRLDMVVEETIVIEIKSVSSLEPIHRAQLITYLKLSDKQLGFLINFNVTVFSDGIKRIVRSPGKI